MKKILVIMFLLTMVLSACQPKSNSSCSIIINYAYLNNGKLTLEGTMPIAPFENTLALNIYDKDKNLLLSEPFMVDGADMGAPATFDNIVDLSSINYNQKMIIILSNLSAKDGSTLCSFTAEIN